MTLPVVWLPEAGAELREAVAHYESVRPELGIRFAEAVEVTVEAIAVGPLQFAVVDKERRRAGVRRFPYGLYFLVEESRIVVIACFLASVTRSTGNCDTQKPTDTTPSAAGPWQAGAGQQPGPRIARPTTQV